MFSSSYDYLGSISGAFGYFTENEESGGKEKRERNGSWDHVLIYSLGAMEVSENQASLLMIHQNQDCSMLGSMLRSIMSENPHVFAQKINLMLGRVGGRILGRGDCSFVQAEPSLLERPWQSSKVRYHRPGRRNPC